MDKICAFFDCQGFYIDGDFAPREAAYTDFYKTCHFSVDPNWKCSTISEADQRSSAYLMENHHGLSILMGDGENLPADMLKLEIEKCYRRTRSVFRVAVKSKEADEYLASCGIPTINLLIYGATHKNIDDGSVHPCSLHCKDICAKPRCALANVHLMRKWVESKRKLI